MTKKRREPGVHVDPSRIKEARMERGLTLGQLAIKCQVSRAFIHLIETGKSRPSFGVLAALCRELGKPLEYFIDLDAPVVVTYGPRRLEGVLGKVDDLIGAAERNVEALISTVDELKRIKVELQREREEPRAAV